MYIFDRTKRNLFLHFCNNKDIILQRKVVKINISFLTAHHQQQKKSDFPFFSASQAFCFLDYMNMCLACKISILRQVVKFL